MVPIEIDIEYAYSILINFIDYSLLCALLSIILYNYINRKIQITGDAILHPSNGEWVLGVAQVRRRPS